MGSEPGTVPMALWSKPSRKYPPVLLTLRSCVVCRWEEYHSTTPETRTFATPDACPHYPGGMRHTLESREARDAATEVR